MDQADLFVGGTATPPGRDFLAHAAHSHPVFVLPCGRRKLDRPAQAKDLYVSPRFRALRRVVEDFGAPYFIASARHGLVAPETVLSPYDEDLSIWPLDAQAQWGARMLDGLSRHGGKPIVFLTENYASAVADANQRRSAPLSLYAPLAHQSPAEADEWVQQALQLAERVKDLRLLYRHIEEARLAGRTFPLVALSEQRLPERGVYIFLDPEEPSAWSRGPRIVRIGTHGVSQGSKSSLRTRLRNHLGPVHGIGSHRGSIFRLHVGRAMLERDAADGSLVPSWGVGQKALKPLPEDEAAHERRVTAYLCRLEVFVFDIDDAPSKSSLRALAETQLISLMTAGGIALEPASSHWLGNYSPMPTIRGTGLWNIRDVGSTYRSDRRGAVADLIF